QAELVGHLGGVAEREGHHQWSVVAAVRDVRRPHRFDCRLVGGGDVHERHPRRAAEANPYQGPQKHPMPHIAGWDGSWSGWSAGVLALGIKAPEVQVRAFCTLPGDLRMLIAGPHPVVSP